MHQSPLMLRTKAILNRTYLGKLNLITHLMSEKLRMRFQNRTIPRLYQSYGVISKMTFFFCVIY